MTIPDELKRYEGMSYTFEDGNVITIKHIKRRDEYQYWVSFTTKTGPGIPKQNLMEWQQFKEHYGHLFP